MLPVEFESRMKKLLSTEYENFAATFDDAPVRAFRINTNKISEEKFLEINPFGGEKIPFADNAFYFDFDGIGNHPYHHAGMVYVQEPAAMSAVASVEVRPDFKVLDLCAAPGGKSSQIAAQLTDGLLISNEIIPSRCKILTGNIERLGFKNVITTCADSKRLAALFGEEFDLVVVDAPCSGEGMFRKDKVAIDEWSEQNVALCAERQREILGNINGLVKDGGYLLYSTCTFSLEENEKCVDFFLKNNPKFSLVPVKENVSRHTSDGIRFDGCETKNIELCRRFYPHVSKGEGQFVALMKKNGGSGIVPKRKSVLEDVPKNEQKIVFDFLDDTLKNYNRNAVKKYKENIVYFEPDFPVPAGIAFSCGVTIGTVKKNYIQPHHQFFMAMGQNFKRKIELTVSEADSYIKGNTVPCKCENGWAVVTVDSCTLGGAKAVNSTAKNHYPKGLRKNI